jgi:immune inhibitor A
VHRVARVVSSVVVAASVVLGGGMLPATGAPPPQGPPDQASAHRPDNLPGPLTARQDARRKAAQELVRSGRAAPDENGVVQLAADKYFQAAVTGTGRVFTVLTDFGDQGSGKVGTTPGPVHNQIAEPDRSVDNSTYWVPDFNQAHYEDMFFGAVESFADFYSKQSSGSYTVDGSVSDWVTVPGNESIYGDNSMSDAEAYWPYIEDTAQAWYDAQIAAGRSLADIKAELATFDVWDRYDQDEDGNFDEPDGYLDHFQAVHAGEGEEAGGGAQGADAIWSHRWYVNGTDYGTTGPTVGGQQVKFGGTPIGDTGIWIGDYTTEPENGGLGVFAHEYGHDLGLPDLYDTSGNTGGAENNTAFWTLMSSGANIGDGGPAGIGDDPTDMSAWELFQLGWLEAQGEGAPFYDVYFPGDEGTTTLSRNVPATNEGPQATFVVLPDNSVTEQIGEPFAGESMFWSGSGDDLRNTMTKTGVSGTAFTAKVDYEIETDWDYAYLEASSDGGETWTSLDTNLSTDTDPHQQNQGNGITGFSEGWVDLTATLPAGTDAVRFR